MSAENATSEKAAKARWWLGGSSQGVKRLHKPQCRFAKHPYVWAGDRSVVELVDALASSGAIQWHEACKTCAPGLWTYLTTERNRINRGGIGEAAQ